MKIFATAPFFILIIGFLSFQSAYAALPTLHVGDGIHNVVQYDVVRFTLKCDSYSPNVQYYIYDNDVQISSFSFQSGALYVYNYLADGGIGYHTLEIVCVDDSNEKITGYYYLDETSQQTTQAEQDVEPVTTTGNNNSSLAGFHFDNGLFVLCFIGLMFLVIILILALSHGGHFKRREKLEPTRQATNIFDMYRDNVNRTIDTRGSLPRGYDETQIDIALPPPTKILDSVWNDADAKKEIVKRIAKDPVAMMEIRRIEMTENLGRVCPRCTDPIRNDRGEIIHCVFCCKFFSTSEQLDLHKCKNSKEAGF